MSLNGTKEIAVTDTTPSADKPVTGRLEPVHLAALQVEHCHEFDLFLPGEGDTGLYRARHMAFTTEDRDRLVENGVKFLQVAIDDRQAYRKYLLGRLRDLAGCEDVHVEERAALATRCAHAVTMNLVEHPDKSESFDEADTLIHSMVELVLKEPDSIEHIVGMLEHDYSTYTHLVNVAMLSLALAVRLGVRSPQRLRDIGLGGLLHDIGKTRIDADVLTSANSLTARQLTELRRHPDYALPILADVPLVTREVLCIVLEHHERLDGNGYPVGLVGKEISVNSQICAVVDIHDGMICARPYRDALDVQFTLDHLKSQSGSRLDERIVEPWIDLANELLEAKSEYTQDAQALAVGVTAGEQSRTGEAGE